MSSRRFSGGSSAEEPLNDLAGRSDVPHLGDHLSRLYSIWPWPADPWSEEGRARYEEAIKKFRSLLEHEWLSRLVGDRRTVRVLDVCGGTGIGGVALGKALSSRGLGVELTVVDLRREALEVAERFGTEELGSVRVEIADATRLWELGLKADLALIYGFSTPHFNPWDMVRLLSSVADSLSDDGGSDRRGGGQDLHDLLPEGLQGVAGRGRRRGQALRHGPRRLRLQEGGLQAGGGRPPEGRGAHTPRGEALGPRRRDGPRLDPLRGRGLRARGEALERVHPRQGAEEEAECRRLRPSAKGPVGGEGGLGVGRGFP